MSANTETWFEVRIDHDLAIMFQRIVNVHARIGKARRADLLARLAAAIPDDRACHCQPDHTGEDIDVNPDCPQHGEPPPR